MQERAGSASTLRPAPAGWVGSAGPDRRTACLIKRGMRLARETISLLNALAGRCTISEVLTAQ